MPTDSADDQSTGKAESSKVKIEHALSRFTVWPRYCTETAIKAGMHAESIMKSHTRRGHAMSGATTRDAVYMKTEQPEKKGDTDVDRV